MTVPAVTIHERSQWTPLMLRRDLIHRRLSMGSRSMWVTKDPVSGNFYYFNEREFAVLRLLDGRKPAAIIKQFSESYLSDYLSADVLVRFLDQIRRSGLLRNESPPSDEQSGQFTSRSRRGVSGVLSPLAIRLPGINPEPLLRIVTPWLSPLFSMPAMLAMLVMMVIGATVAISRAEILISEIREAAGWSTTSFVVTLLVVVSATKLFHELGHAVACRHYGGAVREMGVMFLVFVPCLYCDVSDAWLQSSRWRRIVVSGAGMMVELTIASVAAILWSVTMPGELHWICLSIMVVCSVNTLVFNGNPLMRYDGYYIFADLVRIPNLASESAACLGRAVKQSLWGLEPLAKPRWSPTQRRFMVGYAFLSILYRVGVIWAILFAMHQVAARWQLQVVAWVLSGWVLSTVVVGAVKRLRSWAPATAERRVMNVGRAFAGFAVALLLSALIACFPLPRTVSAPFYAHTEDQHSVYAPVEGRLLRAIREGTEVRKGDIVALLENRKLDMTVEQLRVEEDNLLERLQRIQAIRSVDSDAGSEIPALREAVQATRNQLRLREQEFAQLEIKAPRSGKFYAPLRRRKVFGENAENGWVGTPLDSENRGAFIERGTTIGTVGSEANGVTLFVSQREVELIRNDQTVTVHFPGMNGASISGRVKVIHSQKVQQIDETLAASHSIPADPLDPRRPAEATYRVEVVLGEQAGQVLPLRAVGWARIHVGRASLLSRCLRFLQDSLRFELS